MDARLGAGPEIPDADGDAGDARRHRLPLHDRAEGLLPAGGHRLPDRRHRGRHRHLLRRDEGAAAGAGRGAEIRSGDRIHQLHRRCRRPEHHRELRTPVHCAEAEKGARQPQRDHRAAARQGAPDSGHAGVLPADPEPQYRRPDLQEPVSVCDAERRHRVAVPARARDARQDREAAGPARRHHRSLHQEPADDGRYRPREGRGLRRHRRSGPQPALQRLWLAPGRHHLHAVERLPDHPGSAAAVPRRSVRSVQALHEDPEQRRPSRCRRWRSWCRPSVRCRSTIRRSSRR